jgi:hypothetical protein
LTNGLIEAMRTASESEDPEDRVAVCRALSEAEVFVPLLAGNELWTVSGRDGRPVGLAFTDLDAFRNWRSDGAWGSLLGHDLAAILLEGNAQALIVNVHGPFGGELDRDELDIVASGPDLAVADVVDGVARLAVEDGSAVELFVVAGFPADVRDAVVAAAATISDIEAIYSLRLDSPRSSHPAIGIRAASEAPASAASALAAALQPRLGVDRTLDVVALSPAQLEALAHVPPLYEKQ